MTLNNTVFAAALKELCPQDGINNMVYENHVLLGLLPKKEGYEGSGVKIPVQYARSQNRSASFAAAIASGAPSSKVAFLIQTVANYGIANIDNKTIEDSRSNKGAFISALQSEMDNALEGLARNQSISIYGNGSGAIGQRGSISTNTVTLLDINDVVYFEVGQTIVASPNADGSSPRTGSTTIVAVDRDLGTVTLDSAAAITSFANNDYLFISGDIGAKISGLDAWLPASAPGSTTFFGVNRSVDATRLGGVRVAFATDIKTTLINATMRLAREGGRPDHVFLNPLDYATLLNSLQSDAIFDKAIAQGKDYHISYQAIVLHGATGPIKVLADRDCPFGVAYMLEINTWELWSSGSLVRVFDIDGTPMLRSSATDGVEVRCFSYAQLACKAPGRNARIALS